MSDEPDTPSPWLVFGACLVALGVILDVALIIVFIITRAIR